MRFEEVVSDFEEIVRVETADLGYQLQIERHEGRIAGADDNVVTALRATLTFRREGGTWKISNRHADPILSERTADTLVQDKPNENRGGAGDATAPSAAGTVDVSGSRTISSLAAPVWAQWASEVALIGSRPWTAFSCLRKRRT